MTRRVKSNLLARIVGRLTRRQAKSAINGRRRRAARRKSPAKEPAGGGRVPQARQAECFGWVIYAKE